MANISAQIEATTSYLHLLQAIQNCIRLHHAAGIEVPSLLRAFDEFSDETDDDIGEEEANLFITCPPIPHPAWGIPPEEARRDWIPIPLPEVTPTSLALAILRANKSPMQAADVAMRVRSTLPDVAVNSVYNSLSRITENGDLARSEKGFQLVRLDKAGVISGNSLWAPVAHLLPTELTYHRREAILHILKQYPKIQLKRIIECMNSSEWVQAKGNKDTLKLDMQALEQKKQIKRVNGNRRQWELAS
jgi:hypothetical protein